MPGDIRGNRSELAAEFHRRERLQIENVLMRRPAAHVDVDHRFGGRADARRRLRPQQIRERQPAEAQGPGLQKTPPGHAIAILLFFTPNRQHRICLLCVGEHFEWIWRAVVGPHLPLAYTDENTLQHLLMGNGGFLVGKRSGGEKRGNAFFGNSEKNFPTPRKTSLK